MDAETGARIEGVRKSLRSLAQECKSHATFQTAIGYLVTTYRRVMSFKTKESSKRRILKDDEKFRQNVWRWKAGKELLNASGWIEVGESLFLPNYVDLKAVTSLLEKHLESAGCSSNSGAPARTKSKSTSTAPAKSQAKNASAGPRRASTSALGQASKRKASSSTSERQRKSESVRKPKTATKTRRVSSKVSQGG